ncbi:MAG: ATP-binding protein [Gemmatimonadales bacterium]|nr:ATP-binding protein [Gemmatimonadales bacterium]
MIHSFSVSNYGSIREEVTLDLRIPRTAPDLACFRQSAAQPDLRLPTVGVLMGPNGSGKTTLLRALVDLGRIVSPPANFAPTPLPFMSNQTFGEPTRFSLEGEADFLEPGAAPQRFRYELTIGRRPTDDGTPTDLFVSHEALVHFPKGRRRRLIEWQHAEGRVYVSRDLGLSRRDGRLKAVGPDRSVIATLSLLNVPLAARFVHWWHPRVWLTTNIIGNDTRAPETSTVVGWLEADQPMQWVQEQIQRSDLGIQNMEVIDGADGKQIQFTHSGLDTPIPLRLQSRGTRRLLHLLPLVKWALDGDGLAILDEIDGALHVDMLWEILSQFRSRESNPGSAQLLVSSHHVGLLDDLEKEEIFIVKKNDDGATRVYGAQDVQGLRRDVRLYSKYRAGVLGGLPKFG